MAGGRSQAAGRGWQVAGGRWLAVLMGLALAFGVLTLGPTVWARGQINLFMRDLTRAWDADTLIPSQDACPPADAALARRMADRLARAQGKDASPAMHQGELACIQGDRPAARQSWEAGAKQVPADPLLSLFAAIAAFPDRQIIASPYQKAIGDYGSKWGKKKERQEDIPAAIDWYEFAFAYAPSGATAGKLAALYRQLGQDAPVEAVWQRLRTTFSSDSPEYWWAVGQMAEQQKDWEAAADAYQQAAALVTGADAFRYLLREGLMWLRARDFERSEAAYQKAIRQDPNKVDGYLGMGHVYRYQKQYDQAIPWYEKAIEVAPNHYAAYYYLGTMAREQGDYEQALDYFDKALARNPGYVLAYYQKALTLEQLGKREAAIVALEEAIDRSKAPPQSWQDLLETWRRYPNAATDPQLLWQQGKEAERAGDWEKAASYYKTASEMARSEDAYPYLLQQARMLDRLGKTDESRSIYLRLTQQYPDRVDGYLALGHDARKAGDWDKAEAYYRQAQEVAPDSYQPYLYLGIVARAKGDYPAALTAFDQALALKPDLPNILYYKATVLDAMGQRQEAAQVLDQAIALRANPPESWLALQARWQKYPTNERDPEYWAAQAREAEKAQDWQSAADLYQKAAELAQGEDAYPHLLKLGYMRLRMRSYEEAEQTYRQALALKPDGLDALLGVGETYRYRKEYAEAEAWYRQAEDAHPDNYRPPYHLGIVLYNQKRYDEALQSLDRSLAIQPENPWGEYYRALTLRALRRNEEALASLQKAIEMHKNPPERWQILLSQWSEQ